MTAAHQEDGVPREASVFPELSTPHPFRTLPTLPLWTLPLQEAIGSDTSILQFVTWLKIIIQTKKGSEISDLLRKIKT